jgi:hypothetical protein
MVRIQNMEKLAGLDEVLSQKLAGTLAVYLRSGI